MTFKIPFSQHQRFASLPGTVGYHPWRWNGPSPSHRFRILLRHAGRLLRFSLRSLALLLVIPSLVLAPVLPLSAAPATKQPVTEVNALITDQTSLPLSNQFSGGLGFRLTPGGDVFFTGPGALFQWDSGSSTRSRILQLEDSFPGFPGSVLRTVGAQIRVNALGHTAMVNTFAQKDTRLQSGVFIYDGANYQRVAMTGDVAPGTGGKTFLTFGGLRINDNDEVAFIGFLEPRDFRTLGLFIGSPGGPVQKIALAGEVAPGTGSGKYDTDFFVLDDFNNSGQVTFFAGIVGGTTDFGLFIATPGLITPVVVNGQPAPGGGNFGLFGGVNDYHLNAAGNVAFRAFPGGPGPSVWIGNGFTLTKLVGPSDPTPLGGFFDGGIIVRGFNSAGEVLFESNPVGASSGHALFMKKLGPSSAEVVFSQGQGVPGRLETFDRTQQAVINDLGKVAFLASLSSGGAPLGWFLGGGLSTPTSIAIQGDSTPGGGTYGLGGQIILPEFNNLSQVLFRADILGPNAVGLFRWSLPGGVTSVVHSLDTLPAGANRLVRTFLPGASDDTLGFYAFNAGGRVAAFTRPLSAAGPILRIFGEGDTAPVTGGALYNVLANFVPINNNEEFAFSARVVGGSAYPANGIYTHRPGFGVRKVVLTGDAAPGSGGGTFTQFFFPGFTPQRINQSGQIAFTARTTSGSNRFGIFIGSGGATPQVVVRDGDPAPGGGVFRGRSTEPIINDVGQVGFLYGVDNSPNPGHTGVFVWSAGSTPAKVARPGDPGPFGSTISSILNDCDCVVMNNAGQVGYVANLTGLSPQGIFVGTAGGPQLPVALVHDPAPGTSTGLFSEFHGFDIQINNLGQVGFWARVAFSTSTTGVFLGTGLAPPVARLVEGQALPGGPGAGTSGPVAASFSINQETFRLTNAGTMSLYVDQVNGAPNLPRHVIASNAGVLREFVSTGQIAKPTNSLFGDVTFPVATNSNGKFFFTALLVSGPAQSGVFWDGPAPPKK